MPEPVKLDPGAVAPARAVDFGRRVARGSVTTLAGQFGQMLLQLTSVVVLARMLTPHEYGLFALVVLVVGLGEVFRDFGLSSAAVQADRLTDEQRDALFWINCAIGTVLALLMLLGAPLVALAFGEPELEGICRALSAVFLINGLATQHRADLVRKMRFGVVAGAELGGQVLGVTAAISLAALGASYWALVASQVLQVLTVLLVVVWAGGWRPGRPRRGTGIGPMVRYGKYFVGAQLLNYGSNNLDTLIIGLRFGTGPLGLYNRAFQLVMNPLNQLRKPATTIALPVLSRLNDQPERRDAYVLRGQSALGLTIVVGLSFAAGAAEPLVGLLLGEAWLAATPILALLCVAAGFQMLSFIGYWVYVSRGLTRELFQYSLFSLALRAVCIAAGSQWGLVGVAAGYALAPALAWPVSLWWLSTRTPLPQKALYRGAGRVLGTAVLVGLSSWGGVSAVGGSPDALRLGAAVLAGGAAYGVVLLLSRRVSSDVRQIVAFARRAVS